MRESSDLDNTSSDAELSDWRKEEMEFIEKMGNGGGPVDKRLLDVFRIRKEDQQ